MVDDLPEDYKPIQEIGVRRKDFEALKGFTSEKYKKLKQENRDYLINRRKERQMVKMALAVQILTVIMFISTVTVCCIFGLFIRGS